MSKKLTVFSLVLVLSLLLNAMGVVFPVLAASLPLVDDFESGLPLGSDANAIAVGFVTFKDPNLNSSVAISTTTTPPAQVPGAAVGNTVLKMDLNVVSWAGFVHNFENASVSEWVSQDWSAYEGLSFWLYGNNSGTTMFVDVLDNRNPGSTMDDAERWSIDIPDDFSGWREIQIPFSSMHRKEIGNGAPNDGFGLTEVYGWALGTITTPAPQTYYVDNAMVYGVAPIRPLTVGFNAIDYKFTEGMTATLTAKLSKPSSDPVTVDYRTSFGSAIANRDYTPVSGTLTFAPNTTLKSFTVQTLDDAKYQGERGVLVELSNPTGGALLGIPTLARLDILDNESYDATLLDDFESYPYLWSIDKKAALTNPELAAGDPLALPSQGAYEHVLHAVQKNGKGTYSFSRTFPVGQDWSASGGISFWYYGRNTNKDITLSLDNTPAIASDPSSWSLVWSDEFDGRPGSAPNANVWGQEVGDGTVNGIPGWGNSELEYYTGGTNNVAKDGLGNLNITVKQADGSLMCYYGPCEYTSARLLTKNRFEVAYGRVEARIKVPTGAGLWPAFWMLGTDIDQVSWPQSGEIDIMEVVGRRPNEVFGTLHGPGYSGGQSYGQVLNLGTPVADAYHVFAVEWQPDKIVWTLDGTPYFTATPNDPFLQGKQWVFNHPFFILMNVAIGGNFGGAVGSDVTFPQTMSVDYVRLYQTQPAPTSFSISFREDFNGWRKLSFPFSAFMGADGSTVDTTNIKSIRFTIPDGSNKPVMLDQLRLNCPETVTVQNADDNGAGSLRKALGTVCVGGTINFSDTLAGQTITLLSGPLNLGKNVTIDASAAPGLILSGNHTDRVFIVNAGVTATVKGVTVTNGEATDLAGGILINGNLTLDHAVVSNNHVNTASFNPSTDYWKGGGGIYVGGSGTLMMNHSTLRDNSTQLVDGGGLYGFPGSTITITNSTLSGNTAGNTGGAFRSLGNATITNSTLSGNRSLGWYGGAMFVTDGVVNMIHSTVANNTSPEWAAADVFVGTFTSANATLAFTNSIVSSAQSNCFFAPWGPGLVTLTANHNNLFSDGSCFVGSTDLVTANVGIGPLADNGGPTFTHALLPGSPAIDAADNAACSATDQRGITRPQGAQCDIGSYEAP